jgi:hypothetical protein
MYKFNRGPSFDDVEYPSGGAISILDNIFFVDPDFYDQVSQCLLKMYPYLVVGFEYSASEIVGLDYWSGLSPMERNLSILVLKDISDQDIPMISELLGDAELDRIFLVNESAILINCS